MGSQRLSYNLDTGCCEVYMKPILYKSNETEFTTQGYGTLSDAISCKVTEELNGTFELEMQYPVEGIHYENCALGNIIFSEPAPNREGEPFVIYKKTSPINGIVTIYAEHISYRLSYIPVKPFKANNCVEALQGLVTNSIEKNPFSVWTDKSVNTPFETTIPQSFRTCLGGVEGSILDTYKGEYEFTRFLIKLHTHRGTLKAQAKIVYGKNLIDLTQEETIENTITGIVPYWKGSVTYEGGQTEDIVVTLPENAIQSEYADKYPYKRTVTKDMSEYFESQPTEEQLRKQAQDFVKDNVTGKPDVSLKVSFLALSNTEENRGFVEEMVNIGDYVPVYFYKLGIETTAEVVGITYDALLDRYDEIELGKMKDSISTTIADIQKDKDDVFVKKSDLEIAIALAQKLLNGGLGGYLVTNNVNGHPSEIIIGDSPNIETMVNCIRLNEAGLGLSKSGYAGPYEIAITGNGIVANAVNTGELNGNIIKANTVKIGALDEEVTGSIDNANSNANRAQSTADNAQASADEATSKADKAQGSADSAQASANDAYSQAQQAQADADDATKLAQNAWQGIDNLSQIIVVDNTGVKVKEARDSSNYSWTRSDGMHVMVASEEVAKFGQESHIYNLAVSGFSMFGAHRAETIKLNGKEFTAFFYIGDVK